ncbi:hypothetical protein ALC53_12820 [Atta colombica]|uniref:Uncharacterized protein n=1 Tax=Atta colombica TaxID=520822 RepID=A0A151HYM6_9HYME|nr:hypothetical protein ALC53_12820 [Atta colombica]
MQLSDYDKIIIIQCKIEIDKTIHYCGMHSHVSVVHNGKYLQEIGEQSCKRLHEAGTIRIANAIIDRIKQNTTNLRSVTLVGSAVNDNYGTWDNVFVQASIKITISGDTHPKARAIRSQVLASSKIKTEILPEHNNVERLSGLLFTIHFEQYDTLYEGLVAKLLPKENQSTPIIYTTQCTTFAKTSDIDICGYRLAQTEHPKLLILEKGRTFHNRSKVTIENLDIFLYVNSKFIYVEKHIKTQLTQLYQDIMYYVTTGEVIHLVKCIPVEVKLRYAEQCYNELIGVSFFLLPKIKDLIKNGHSKSTWHYTSPSSLATSGIYNNEDIDRLRSNVPHHVFCDQQCLTQ